MQDIMSSKGKRAFDGRLSILVLQIVTVVVILVFALAIRLFGGALYDGLSKNYHEKFDDITRATDVLEPNVETENSDAETDEKNEVAAPNTQSNADTSDEIEGTATGYITDSQEIAGAVPVSVSSNTFLWPVSGNITSDYGYRTHPITGKYSMHGGIDISASRGTDIKTAYDGKISSTGYSQTYGYYVIISHNENVQTLYAHCDKLIGQEGEYVKKGETVALVGSTGRSTGPHLHFEIRVGGMRIDPKWILGDAVKV